MWTSLLAVGIFATLACGGQIFDVTTIYNIGACDGTSGSSETDNTESDLDAWALEFSNKNEHGEVCPNGLEGRVHARTNALGLSYHNGNNRTINRTTLPYSSLTCDFKEEGCNWDYSEWNLIPIDTGLRFIQGKAYALKNQQVISLNQPQYGSAGKLYVKIGEGIKDKVLFVFYFNILNYHPTIYEECNPQSSQYHIEVYNRYGTVQSFYCRQYSLISDFDYANDYLVFQLKSGKLQLYRDLAKQKLIREWPINEEDSNNIFYSLSHTRGEQSLIVPVLQSSTSSSSQSKISSPLISLDNRELCLTILLKADQSTELPVLQIQAEDIYQAKHFLHTVTNVKDYYQVKHYNISLGNHIPTPIKIVISHIGSIKVEIARISSCSAEGEEVELLPKIYPRYQNFRKYYDFSVYTPYLLDLGTSMNKDNNSICLNGGVSTSEGCACRPGFVGKDCKTGCGKNQFGQDCLGLCSLHDQECKGLLLCTNITGCHCAPGYSGEICTDKCSSRMYGSDCEEPCGHCIADEPCDIYSGECTGCEPGYYPPYCKDVFVYYSSTPDVSSDSYGIVTVTFNPSKNIRGYGDPKLYQIQYREKGSKWIVHTTMSLKQDKYLQDEMDETISEDITTLKNGAVYEVRILLMDSNFNKYDGGLVGVGEIVTKCDIPEYYDYKIQSASNTTSFSFSWNYANQTIHRCPLEGYEISWKDGWKWYTNFTEETSVVLTEFMPDSTIQFKVRAKTTGGYAPNSKKLVITTQPYGSTFVRDLRTMSSKSTSVAISWNPPRRSENKQLQYTISYKCVEQPACHPGCHNATDGLLTQDQTSVTLGPLLPFAQYMVTVTPQDGIKSIIYVGTSNVAPTETPKLSTSPPQRTNTSITVFWEEVPVCSSFLQGYNYQLTKKNEDFKILNSGFTKDTKISFHNLTASTNYIVKIFIVTVAGWNAESFLSIDASTSATVPEAVRGLEIYKRSRNMLGLRWAEPLALYGQLKSFAVSYSLGHNVTTQTVAPTPCVAWPHLYCHTIEGLKTGRRYNITVSARNTEIEDNGEQSVVSGITKESLPTAPENLKVLNKSSTSVALQWGYPNLTNGVLRSFVINVEETEKYDDVRCCDVYPLMETPVDKESPLYDAEVSDLHPAATYFVSVSAKTIGMGPSPSLVIHTRPPHLPFTAVPQTELSLTWLPQQQLPEVNNSDIYTSLIKANFLIAVFNDTSSLPAGISESGVLDPQLESLLNQTVNKPFVFVTEYDPEELLELYLDTSERESTWGQAPTSYESFDDNQLVAVQVTEYNSVYNVDLRYSVTKQ